MKYFLSETSLRDIGDLDSDKILYAFDFDGTLARIVTESDAAYMSTQTEKLLEKLSERATVAVISGRSRTDLNLRLPNNIHYTIGNHGLEGLKSHSQKIQNAKVLTRVWRTQLKEKLKNSDFEGVELEDKTYSLTLHYRKSPNKQMMKNKLLNLIGTLEDSPRIILGKSVINVIPMGAPHKGMALLELMLETGATKALYVGDDDTDEDIFSLPDERIIGVRVGKKKLSHAKYYLNRQSEITILLRRLLQMQERPRERTLSHESSLL